MKKKYSLTITHLYPKYMCIYGDMGNVITLKKRCEWRGIKVNLVQVSLRDKLPEDADIYFMGGGQDKDQMVVYKDFIKKKKILKKQIKDGVCFLAVCGGYQLLGKHFITGDGTVIEGLGALDVRTEAPGTDVKVRCIGNAVGLINNKKIKVLKGQLQTIVGFENHSGQTYLGKNAKPLARVLVGNGNNVKDSYEGCVKRNVIGTYLHGSFLPKNPHIADWLIRRALKRKYGKKVRMKKLKNDLEWAAHEKMLDSLGVKL